MEGMHTGFLRQITGKRGRCLGDGKWETPGAEGVREAVGMQFEMTYIGRRQATVEQWVALSTLFEVCAGGKSYEGGGIRR